MSVEDTSKRDPIVHVAGIMAEGQSDYIANMEKQGQKQLVNSTAFPIDCNFSDEQDLLDLGFVLGDKVDDLFREVQLPEGWEKRGSDHAMWSYIYDERGLPRVSIFYKAAFYDRSAHWSLVRDPAVKLVDQAAYDTSIPVPWAKLTIVEIEDVYTHLVERLENKYTPDDVKTKMRELLAHAEGYLSEYHT